MSVKLVSQEIRRFLKSSEPEVMCLMGKWGVGKTFTWNKYLNDAILDKAVDLKRYSYVSLFGQNSLEELKYAIFESTTSLEQVEAGPTIETFKKIGFWGEGWFRKASPYLKEFKFFGDYSQLLTSSLFLTVRNQIVCIDDLERVGDGLSTKNILGLVSYLKEQRKCKVVLLLNNEGLQGEAEKEFNNQLEKVVDVEMRFEPTALEAAEIGIDKTNSFYEILKKNCVALEIVNVRVIRKIQRLAKRFEELISGHDMRILESAVPSIVLFGWCVYQPTLAPSPEYIKNFNRFSALIDNKTESEQEQKWRAPLTAMGFLTFDGLDELLLISIQRGYFDEVAVEEAAQKFDKEHKIKDQDNSFHSAWNKFHHSFKDNADEVLDEMYEAFKKGIQAVSPQNLDGTINLFRKMGREKQADEMVDMYMKERNEGQDFYDPNHSMFLNIKDEKLAKAFSEKLTTFKDERKPKDILINIATYSGWNPEDINTLSNVSSSEFYEMFKQTEGLDLRTVVSQALKFGKYGDASQEMIKISTEAEKALQKIAKESDMNAERVRTYGIIIESLSKEEKN